MNKQYLNDFSGYEWAVCRSQGRLFEESAENGYASVPFIRAFMMSEEARLMDCEGTPQQWMGASYVLEGVENECKPIKGETADTESMYWLGMFYRVWHYMTGESSKEIIKRGDPERLLYVYDAYHTLDLCFAVERWLENH